jgi:hypothetical protein
MWGRLLVREVRTTAPFIAVCYKVDELRTKKIKIIVILLGCDSNTDDDSSLLGCYVMSTAIKFFS